MNKEAKKSELAIPQPEELPESLKRAPKITSLLPLYYQEFEKNIRYEPVEVFDVDGHEVSWMEYRGHVEYDIMQQGREGEEFVGRVLKCEGEFKKGVGWKIEGEHRYNLDHDDKCMAKKEVIRQRQEELRLTYVEKFKDSEKPELKDHMEEIVFDLMEKRRNGESLERTTGAEFWGGYFYTETVKNITGTTWEEFWDSFGPLLKEEKLMLDGAVVKDYTPPPPPTWEEYGKMEKDGYTVAAYLPTHRRMNQNWVFELTDSNGQILEPNLGPKLSHIPTFGPDVDDVAEIQEVLIQVLENAKTAPPSTKPKLLPEQIHKEE